MARSLLLPAPFDIDVESPAHNATTQRPRSIGLSSSRWAAPDDQRNVVQLERLVDTRWRWIALRMDALRRAQLMSSETRGIKLTATEGGLRISGDNPDIGEAREDLDATYSGDEISVGFNPKYVIELLSQISEDGIVIELSGELDPVLIRPASDSGYIGVVMPMHI